MAFHKQKQYDPTEAFLLNQKQQKLLLLRLKKIDKLWYKSLKHLSRDRLEATTDLMKLEDEKQQLEYYDHTMEVHKMKDYNDECIRHMRVMKRELTHDNFNFDSSAFANRKLPIVHNHGTLNLPRIDGSKCFITQKNGAKKQKERKQVRKRRQSNLMRNRIFSMSDSNLDKVSKSNHCLGERSKTLSVSHEDLSNNIRVHNFIAKLALSQSEETKTTVLPNISSCKAVPEEHRYLKQKMATTLALPTVTEVDSRQRKISV